MPLSAGDKLGPYEILARLGAGGMGEVWKARDTRLGRTVAIKHLNQQHSVRFEQEARAVAALNHAHICQIFDIGPDYLVMEYVEGKPLSGPLPAGEALDLALQIAGAIEEAHANGVLHRDLKPANVLVTSKGAAKLLDFGLAKRVGESAADVTQTTEGVAVGTAAYMSPEQAEGRPVDQRSDIFSFGAMLYEMLTGSRAFSGNSTAQVLIAILRDEPAPLATPPAIQQIIDRCLAKERDSRFANAAELRAALEDAAAITATKVVRSATSVLTQSSLERSPDRASIAVLPFANLSADKENEYFSDGLSEEILNLLTKIPSLKVIARTSSFMFRGSEQDVRTVAKKLDVRTILEGSVRRAGSRIRVTAQLIDARDANHIWSERYDRELTDVFAVQDEIAAAIAGALRLKLADELGHVRHRQPTIPAYEAWLKGRHYSRKVTPDSIARSKEYFEQAIALDPYFAEAYADLGGAYLNLWTGGLRPGKEVVPLIRAKAQRAVELSHAAGHALLGTVATAFDYDWKGAELHFNLFLSSGERKEEAHASCAHYYLAPFSRTQEAVDLLEKLVESDPLSVRSRSALGNHLTIAERYDDAIRELQKALEVDDRTWYAHAALVRSYILKGMAPEALRSAETAHQLAPWNSVVTGQLAGLLVRAGDRSRGEALIREFMESSNPRNPAIGMLYYSLMREDIQVAASWFERAVEEREPMLIPHLRHPLMKPLRASPRWPVLARMMNLPQSIE